MAPACIDGCLETDAWRRRNKAIAPYGPLLPLRPSAVLEVPNFVWTLVGRPGQTFIGMSMEWVDGGTGTSEFVAVLEFVATLWFVATGGIGPGVRPPACFIAAGAGP